VGRFRSSAQIWEGDSGRHVPTADRWVSAGFSPDGRWLATLASGQDSPAVGGRGPGASARNDDATFAFSPDSRLLALSDVRGVIRLVTTDGGREFARLTGSEPGWYSPACFSSDGTPG
jgi:hypothetical protein